MKGRSPNIFWAISKKLRRLKKRPRKSRGFILPAIILQAFLWATRPSTQKKSQRVFESPPLKKGGKGEFFQTQPPPFLHRHEKQIPTFYKNCDYYSWEDCYPQKIKHKILNLKQNNYGLSLFTILGKGIHSRICSIPAIQRTARSTPIPKPA